MVLENIIKSKEVVVLLCLAIVLSFSSVTAEPILWDTVGTSPIFDGNKASPTPGERVGLIVSNFGEVGHMGLGGVNMDYFLSGEECGTKDADKVYLYSSSPFLLVGYPFYPDAVDDVSLTTSIYQLDDSRNYSWKPVAGPHPMSSGLTANNFFDSVYTGKMVNKDTTIAIEQTYYAPRELGYWYELEFEDYIIVHTYLYSADSQPHDNVTFGIVTDWNLPSDSMNMNSAIRSHTGGFLAIQGVDTSGHEDPTCTNVGRFGADITIYSYLKRCSSCWHSTSKYASYIGNQLLLKDTNLSRSGEVLSPPQPDPIAWLEEITLDPRDRIDAFLSNSSDKASWNTVVFNVKVNVWDTLEIFTAYVVQRDGTLSDFELNVEKAKNLAQIPPGPCSSCCCGIRGDANVSGQTSVGDIGQIVNMLFGTGEWVECLTEADANVSGDIYNTQPEDITIGDIAAIVDHLFGSGVRLPSCW